MKASGSSRAWGSARAPASASAATRSTAPASSMRSTLFEADPDTDAVLMMGEIGGNAEEQAAALKAAGKFTKPLAAFIAGQTAPPGKRMGHAGAIISGGSGKASDKIAALEAAGITRRQEPRRHGRHPPGRPQGMTDPDDIRPNILGPDLDRSNPWTTLSSSPIYENPWIARPRGPGAPARRLAGHLRRRPLQEPRRRASCPSMTRARSGSSASIDIPWTLIPGRSPRAAVPRTSRPKRRPAASCARRPASPPAGSSWSPPPPVQLRQRRGSAIVFRATELTAPANAGPSG